MESFEAVDSSIILNIYLASAAYWTKITHLFYECLQVDSQGNISIYESPEVLKSPATYIAEMHKLKQMYGLKIVLAFNKPFKFQGGLQFFNNPKNYFKSIEKILDEKKFEGLEVDLSNFGDLTAAVYDSIIELCDAKYKNETYIRIGSHMKVDVKSNIHFLKEFTNLGCKLILNSSGYHKSTLLYTDGIVCTQIVAGDQCSYNQVLLVLEMLLQHIDSQKILLNFPTSACLYKVCSHSGVDVVSDVQEVMGKDVEDYDDFKTHQPLIVEQEGATHYQILSFDSFVNRVRKIVMVRNRKLCGVVMDDNVYDLAWNNCRSLSHLLLTNL
jgi:hypothetical protein